MRIGIIADIHSNAPALEAVLEDLSRCDLDLLVHLGDAFNGPIDPPGVAALLRSRPMVHVRGNGERMVVSEDASERSLSAAFARERLSAEQLAWIGTWPEVYRDADVPLFACHGSPASDTEYLLEDVTAGALRPLSAIRALLGQVRASLVLCAHSHVPRLVRVDRAWVVNPGSVGLPAYALDVPVPHRMEAGSPCARYAVAERSGAGWRVSQLAVPYDHERAAAAAARAGFDDWSRALRTGYV